MRVKIEQLGIDRNYKRVFMISDIHNHYKSFCQMRNQLNWGDGDLIIIVGDIVDRGGNEADPLSLCSEVRFDENRKYEVVMLKGNHEKWLASAIRKYCMDDICDYRYNSLNILREQLSKEELIGYADWMEQLPLGIDMSITGYRKKFKIAHASTIDITSESECLMGSPDFYFEALKQKKYTSVVGHTVTSIVRYYFEEFEAKHKGENTDIFCVGNKIWCIDCGNGFRDDEEYPGKLGCIELIGNGKIKEHYV